MENLKSILLISMLMCGLNISSGMRLRRQSNGNTNDNGDLDDRYGNPFQQRPNWQNSGRDPSWFTGQSQFPNQGQNQFPRPGQGQGQNQFPRPGQGQGQNQFPRPGQGQNQNQFPRPGQGQGQTQLPGQGQGQGQSQTTIQPAQNGAASNQVGSMQDCIRSCPVTSEYNPICGTDNVTYSNPGRLTCAQLCGVNVNILRLTPCPAATTTAAPDAGR